MGQSEHLYTLPQKISTLVCVKKFLHLADKIPKSNDGITPLQLMEKAKSLGALFTQQQCGIIQTNK